MITCISQQPTADISLLSTELNTDLDQFPPVRLIRDQVAFIIDLAQGLLGGAVQLELEDVDVFRSLHHSVRTTTGTANLSIGKLTHQLKDQVENHLVVAFRLVVELVWEVGEKGLKAGEEGVVIAMLQFIDKFTDIKSLVIIFHRSVKGD